MMGESNDSNSVVALANESKHEITSISPPIFCDLGESSMEQMEVNTIVKSIEKSKSHWSHLMEFDCDNEVAEVNNVQIFQTLQRHPTWGTFFKSFGDGRGSSGKLVMGRKFAEGKQAEIYEVQIKWNNRDVHEFVRKNKHQYALKVFKKGTFLRHMQLQWPQGMLQFHADIMNRQNLGVPQLLRFHSDILGATLLEDGRFAFVMVKEDKDLRSMIDQCMLARPKDKGPFSKNDVELIIYDIAYGIDQLHGRGIVHRDIKASNVLITRKRICYIADFECSVGVVGTGFLRAPEILEACKYGNVNEKVELFTKVVDVYSYGMICYEILTDKLPFEGHPEINFDLILKGERPKVLEDVDGWICKLLDSCWQSNLLARPSFKDILKELLANSEECRERKLATERQELELGIRKDLGMDSKMTKLKRSLRMVKLKVMSWIGRNLSC